MNERRRTSRTGEGSRFAAHAVAAVVATAALGLGATLCLSAVPGLGFGFEAPALRAAIEAAASVVALLAAYLVAGRFDAGGRVRDLALVLAFGLLAISNLVFSALPLVTGWEIDAFGAWAPAGARLLAALALAVAALVPDLRLGRPRRDAVLLSLAALVTLLAVALVAAVAELPAPPPLPPAATADVPDPRGPLGYVVLQALTMIVFAVAAGGFAARARRSGDGLVAWIAVAAVLGALARVDELLFPVWDTDAVMAADILRLGFYLALLAGALAEIAAYQRRLAVTAILDERRRVARDLHDGMAQELAFILQQSRRLASGGDARAGELARAAERAFDESRAAIAALRRRGDEPFAAELSEVAEQLTARAGARLRLEVDPDIDVEAERRDHLLRIVREAVTNGVRHGAATEIVLRLSNGDGLRLVVRDNGKGFADDAGGGYGLVGMRERVRVLGGQLDVRSDRGRGTEVEVVLP